jgi:hypothetical protein
MIGIHHIGFEGATSEEEVKKRTLQMLSSVLNSRRVVACVGSGISTAYGYDNWDKFAQKIVEETWDEIRDSGVSNDDPAAQLLRSYTGNTKLPSRIHRSDRILLMLAVYDELLTRYKNTGSKKLRNLHEIVADRINQIGQGQPSEQGADPLRVIIETLEIRRFLTTNYDLSIEKALGHDVQPLAFDVDHPEALIQFAVAAPGYDTGVFHLHGSVSQPKSLVVTENDYQRLYLQDDPAHRFYHEALDLVFSSNPVLFMGIGMEEADLLRPLRQFVSERHRGARERPLFALMERPQPKVEAIGFRRYLYARIVPANRCGYIKIRALFTYEVPLCVALKSMTN